MRAVVCREGVLTVEELDTPEPGRGEILLRVVRAGICGSDLHARTHGDATADVADEVGYSAFMRSNESVVMGHEFVGEIVAYGPGCRKRWEPGTAVVSLPMISHDKHPHLIGLSASAPGAFADYVLVAEDMSMPVPEELSLEQAALTEPMAVAYHAVRRSEIGKRDVAVVIGCGPIGLAVVAALKAIGVRTVVASDLSATRRDLAWTVGADVVVDPRVESPWDRAAEKGRHLVRADELFATAFTAMHQLQIVPRFPWWTVMRLAERFGAVPRGPVVFECVGVPGMIEEIVSHTPLRSRVVVVGLCMEPDTFRPAMAINKEIDLRFAFGYDPAEFRTTLHMIADGQLDVSPLVTGTVGLDGVVTAFDALGSAERHAKILIDPSSDVATV